MSRSDEERLESSEFGSMAYDAVLRNLAVIGEAVKALPAGLKAMHSEILWPSIVGLRNVVVHEYFRVNPELVRDIVDVQLRRLAAVLGQGFES
ncbi:DUF86 domain-containing protein [Nocardioides sp. DS6]|uniref:DUF86 domain-containing protein n=1 Tax=Nocardioides eburneus TaxID=3231482 RepID=A0ABV3T3K0_9ACTN